MAQEDIYIAIRSDKLSKPNDERYVVINKETHEVVDDGLGHGYKSPKAAHASFSYKMKWVNKMKPKVINSYNKKAKNQ